METINLTTGIISQALFALCVLPQIIKVLRTKSVRDVSLAMWVAYFVAQGTSIIYFGTLVVIPWLALVQVSLSLCMATIMLTLIYKYSKK